MGISYEEVQLTAEKILSEGENPTIERIRSNLGTGSNSTIAKYLQRWRQHSSLTTKSKISAPPDMVKVAVDRVWNEIKEQTDKEIDSIKIEAQTIVENAEKKVELAEFNLKQLKTQFDQLQEVYHAQSAAKELLQLNYKSLQEDHRLLEERYQTLENRYAEMQSLTTYHLKDLAQAHQHEVQRLEEIYRSQAEAHTKLVDAIKDQNEKERQSYLVTIDNLKTDDKKSKETFDKLQKQVQEKINNIKELEADIRAGRVECNNLSNQLEEHEKKWSYFHDKTLISPDILTKIYDTPKLDDLIEKINIIFENSIEKRFLELKEAINDLHLYSLIKHKDIHKNDE